MSALVRKITTQLPLWAPSLVGYGATLGLAGLYFTDWKVIVTYIPLYNTKFNKGE